MLGGIHQHAFGLARTAGSLQFAPTQHRHYLRFPIALRELQALDQFDVRRNAKIGVWANQIRSPGPTVRH